MILVEPTSHNWEIFDQLCEIDAEYRICEDEESRRDLISLANKLCEELELN